MKVRVLEVMQTCKQAFEDKALEARCISRVEEIRTIVRKYQRTLNPHNFCPSMEDVWQVPEIRKVIIDGIDEEFNTCAETLGLPKLTSQILEERTARISALLPSNERSDNAHSLAATWFRCRSCYSYMGGAGAVKHWCPIGWELPSGKSTGVADSSRALRLGWCPENFKFEFSEAASNIGRGLILNCGEDPEAITSAEMSSKLHRFVYYEKAELVARNWEETVSSGRFLESIIPG